MKYFLIISLLTIMCYGQRDKSIDPAVAAALHKCVYAIKQTMTALRQDKINEAVGITCNQLAEENKLSPDIFEPFAFYVSLMVDHVLRENVYKYYFQAGGRLNMPNEDTYSIVFSDVLCRDAWCKLQQQTMNKYTCWQEIMDKTESDQALDAVINESKAIL